MRYIISRMDQPAQLDESNTKAEAINLYEAAIRNMRGASIRLLDRRGHTVLMQNYGDENGG